MYVVVCVVRSMWLLFDSSVELCRRSFVRCMFRVVLLRLPCFVICAFRCWRVPCCLVVFRVGQLLVQFQFGVMTVCDDSLFCCAVLSRAACVALFDV